MLFSQLGEYYLQAASIADEARQTALLLHLVGSETQEIFETFSETGDDLKTALAKLDSYFSPKRIHLLKDTRFMRQNRNQRKV